MRPNAVENPLPPKKHPFEYSGLSSLVVLLLIVVRGEGGQSPEIPVTKSARFENVVFLQAIDCVPAMYQVAHYPRGYWVT